VKLIKLRRILILTLFLISISTLNPLFFTFTQSNLKLDNKPNLSQPVILRMGVSASIVSGNWDPVITDNYNILEYYKRSCLESLFWFPNNSTEPESQLATSWEYEYRPEGFNNSLGFNNSGGVKAINITLRDGVTFSDGSNWNATAAKWNIDRHYLISGNLTGGANGVFDQRNAANWWIPFQDWVDYFTADWNLSEYETGPSYYYIGDPANPANKVENPLPSYDNWVWNGTDMELTAVYTTPWNNIPMVRWVEIIEDLPSGGKIRVELNSWNLLEIEDNLWTPQISHHAYNQDYTETGIYGYDNDDPGAPELGHIIGTGPYIFVEHDELADGGYLLKNENYWNKTALEAEGWFDADQVELVQFGPGDLGRDAKNTALLAHEIDYVYDTFSMPIDYDAVIANPDINYIEYGVSDYITQITLNSINETWWSGGVAKEFNGFYDELPYGSWNYSTTDLMYNISGTEYYGLNVHIPSWWPNEQGVQAGIPRLLREALTYAFDYDTLINVDLNDRVVRAGGMLGVDNVYYNSSVPLADYNLTHARKVLLEHDGTDQYSLTQPWWPFDFSALLAARGIDENSSDMEWQTVASMDPIFTLNFYWDDLHQELADTFEKAANNLGVALIQDADNKMPAGKIIWDVVGSYWNLNFDGVSSIWSASAWPMDYYMPDTSPLGYVQANYGDPDRGTWRAGYYPVGSDYEYWPMWNFGFSYDTEIDNWLDRAKYSNQTGRKYWLNNIAEKEHNELYPMIYAYQAKEGRVLWNEWEMNFNRGDLFFANFRYTPPPPTPGDIALSSDAGSPDYDGNFNLIWNVSLGADNYSIYRYHSEITQINGSLVLVSDQVATSPFPISGLTDGDYYFVVAAYNEIGVTLSNNLHITVQIGPNPPGTFILSTDADFPDNDGFFNLTWTNSDGADNYSLYMHNQQISVIDSSLTLLQDEIATSPFPVFGFSNGEYYFVVAAKNQYGDTMSNNVHINVNKPVGPSPPGIPGYNTLVLLGFAVCSAVLIFKKIKLKFK
jgi:ABC-type transport system substrate-binding protein